jgi:hypothetical protein
VHHDEAIDVVFTDQLSGPTAPCPWLGFGLVTVEGDRIPAAWLAGTTPRELHGPVGWRFAGSLSQTYTYVTAEGMAKSVEYLGHKDGVDWYRSRLTGEAAVMARAGRKRLG